MPGSDGTPAPRRRPESARFRRAAPDVVARAARRVVRGAKASFRSQSAFRAAVLETLRRDEPLATVGGLRLRRLVLDVPGVRLSVRYRERPGRPVPESCPVCADELRPIRNRTLAGETVVLGKRCVRCDYWTHAVARVPVRYAISQASGRRPTDRVGSR